MKRLILAALLCSISATFAHAQIYVNTGTSVSEYTEGGTFLRNVVTTNLTGGFNVTFGTDGLLYVADDSAGAVKKFNPDTGAFIGNVVTGLNRVTDCTFGADGNLYVAEFDNSRVLRINPANGAVLQAYTGISSVTGLEFMPNGDLLATEGTTSNSRVVRINTTTGNTSTFLTSSLLVDVELLSGGDYVFTDRNGSRLHRTSASGGSFTDFTNGFVSGFPYFMDSTASTLYVGSINSGISRYDVNSGAFLGNFGPSGTYGVAVRPTVVAVPEVSALTLFVLPILTLGVMGYRRSTSKDA